jgi:phosphatidylglycerol lysyltransferase
LHDLLREFHPRAVAAALDALRPRQWTLALACTGLGYLILTLYDALALRALGRSLGPWRTMATSFMGFSIGNNLGVAALSGGWVRYRLYSANGLAASEIAWIIGFCSLTFFLGVMSLLGLSLLVEAGSATTVLHVQQSLGTAVGVALLAIVAAYLVLTAVRRRPLEIGSRSLILPRFPTAVLQVVVGCADLAVAAGVLYVLLPAGHGVSFEAFVGLYVLAIAAGSFSNVPGGLGVFETAIIACLPQVAAPALLGSLLVYRAVYYLVPFAIALTGLVVREARSHREGLGRVGSMARNWIAFLVPQALAVASFLAGMLLLFSGVLPADPSRIAAIEKLLPLPLLEASHLVGSAAGVMLLLVAQGLYRRVDGAWHVAMWLLAAGVVASMLKGVDYEEGIVLTLMIAALWIGRNRFDRPASLLQERYSAAWTVAVAVAIGASIWVGLFAYRHVPYRDELWWQFARDADAPRMLRASLLVVLLVGGSGLWRLLRPARPAPATASPDELALAASIASRSRQSQANLALLGDKRLLFDEASGRSWVAMGDPVGPRAQQQELVWRFRELCDHYDAWPVFYEVGESTLPLYVDAGLSLSKLGEEARVALAGFSLDGSQRAALRQSHRKAIRDGAALEIVPAERVAPLLDALEQVSHEWLASKSIAEKGFSLGFFDRAYLQRGACAVVRCDGPIVAFANIWASAELEECSIDLMRHTRDAPKGIMDFLFVELMLWARAQGYRYFNLGMAPLSGLEQRRLAPLWNRTGAFIYRYGEHFYNFEGLRKYKEKFQPEWQSRYLAAPGGIALPRILLDVSRLISGGVMRIVTRPVDVAR